MYLKLTLLIICWLQAAYGFSSTDPIVDTDAGQIRGLRADDGDYSMFLGIPFAQVNKDNPFGAASPYPRFESTFDAYDDSAVCPQIEEFNNTIVGSLDCLNLNVFVPSSASPTNRLPVLVYIHGGGYSIGFGNRFLYGASFLVRYDIILVSINYRIGPYGFMCLDTPEVPGNQGIKDQALALRWIQRNIGAFNGDPDKVTISGNSAGSFSVDFHLLSNHEKLFDKVIFQSGNVLNPGFSWPLLDAPITIAAHFGYRTEIIDEALRYISQLDTGSVIAATNQLGLRFQPCVEKEFDGVENLVTEHWTSASLPKIKNVPILIGVNSDELLLTATSENDEDYVNRPVISSSFRSAFNVSHPDFEGMEEIAFNFYFGDAPITAAKRQRVSDFSSDFTFNYPVYRSINKYLEYEPGNIYFYILSYVGQRNFVRNKNNIPIDFGGGAVHADEIGFLYDISYMKDFNLSAEEQLVVDRMTALWANFVKYGNPTPATSALLPVIWPSITSASTKRPYMDIGADLVIGDRPFNDRAAFWDLFFKANGHLILVPPPHETSAPSSSFTAKAHPLAVTLSLVFIFVKFLTLS